MRIAEGPYFEDLRVGQVFDGAPAMTLTEGRAAAHQAITGDRLRLPLDSELCRRVAGGPAAPIAHPALVWDVAIGQSTLVTQHVVANLFYRGLVFHRVPRIGDTLHTCTAVTGLRQNRLRPERQATGLAALRITTVDQNGQPVLDFRRCAMLPLRDPEVSTGHRDDLDASGGPGVSLSTAVRGWVLGAFRDAIPGPHAGGLHAGSVWEVGGGDVVSSAPELARLTLNIAAVHHDASTAGHRLVYGGHTIGLALSQATRALPNLVTVTGWHGCDHTGPVREGDTLTSRVEVHQVEPLPGEGAGTLAHLRSTVRATSTPGAVPHDVLDWRYVAVLA